MKLIFVATSSIELHAMSDGGHISISMLPHHESRDPRPPLYVKVTGYRLLSITMILAFGIAKAALAYNGQSAVSATPTTLDWVMGVIIAIGYSTI